MLSNIYKSHVMYKRLEEKNIVPNSIIQMTEVKIKRQKKKGIHAQVYKTLYGKA